mmetsp:Transcript_22658/g.47525  ORF Transcript_22658/g.47525 Transcript_22658/m.47525 type:complete len:112 (-) Transcript_22658:359-694(-)
MLLLPIPHPAPLIIPRSIIPPNRNILRQFRSESLFQYGFYAIRLRGEGDDGYVDVLAGGKADEVGEDGAEVGEEFGGCALPPASGVDGDEGLVEVQGEEVDFYLTDREGTE